jgi:hypothetical protein
MKNLLNELALAIVPMNELNFKAREVSQDA